MIALASGIITWLGPFLACAVLLGCRESVSDPGKYLQGLTEPANGMILNFERRPVRYELLYRPESYFLAQKLDALTMRMDESTIDSLTASVNEQFGKAMYFVFSVRANPGDMDKVQFSTFTAFQNSWVVHPHAFTEDAVIVTKAGDSLRCTMAEPRMERVNGLSVSVFLGFAVPKAEMRMRASKLMIRNHGFWTELVEFNLDDFKPRLKFVPKRNGNA